mmetsp:Transcript_72584/g.206702  ORF Transcript_72584/g.206702 Transcript_72584/m.206702 type:complete len:289 (+) Transcript_72584:387-1253(+)
MPSRVSALRGSRPYVGSIAVAGLGHHLHRERLPRPDLDGPADLRAGTCRNRDLLARSEVKQRYPVLVGLGKPSRGGAEGKRRVETAGGLLNGHDQKDHARRVGGDPALRRNGIVLEPQGDQAMVLVVLFVLVPVRVLVRVLVLMRMNVDVAEDAPHSARCDPLGRNSSDRFTLGHSYTGQGHAEVAGGTSVDKIVGESRPRPGHGAQELDLIVVGGVHHDVQHAHVWILIVTTSERHPPELRAVEQLSGKPRTEHVAIIVHITVIKHGPCRVDVTAVDGREHGHDVFR